MLGCVNQNQGEDSIHLFPLKQVQLLESPFEHAMQTNRTYIMQMNPDRLLAPYLREAGLKPLAEPYGNWESEGLDGHIAGHYLSSLALYYASTGDEKAFDRLNYMLEELKKSQDKHANGYIGGIPGGINMWEEIASGEIRAAHFSLNEKWVPWYNIHKIFAGLYDAYHHAEITLARDMLVDLTDWVLNLVSGLNDDQIQDMLLSEHGGINEVFAQVAEITGDEKYLVLAKRFSHKQILNPLLNGQDNLDGLHANTQIPKVLGFKRIADISDDDSWNAAARFFWDAVVHHRSVSIGGHSVREHFHPRNNFSTMIIDREGPETCNTYNMLKLTRQLFATSGEASYIDFYERALYNNILSSQHPEHGGLVYFTPMRPGHYRVYSQPETNFWCCVGSGIENHMKYGELIYAHTSDKLFVNLFIPSILNWEEKGIKLTQQTHIPGGETTKLTFNIGEPVFFELNIRYPNWVKEGDLTVFINEKKHPAKPDKNRYVNIGRKWENGDKVEVLFPMHTYLEQLPDGSPYYSLFYGPLVLAAKTDDARLDGLIADGSRMGHIANGPLVPLYESPMWVSENKEQLLSGVVKKESEELVFAMDDMVYPEKFQDIQLIPFYELHDARYMIYWQMSGKEELENIIETNREAEKIQLELENRTIDQVAAGEQQPESEHGFRGHQTEVGIHQNRLWRHAYDWFSYDLIDKENAATTLQVTYFGADRDRHFDILINEMKITSVHLDGSHGDKFFSVDYPIPDELLKEDRDSVFTIKFSAHEGSIAGGIYHVRLLN